MSAQDHPEQHPLPAGTRPGGRGRGALAAGLGFVLVFVLIGELDFRLRPRETRLEFDVHEQLYHRLRPGQAGYLWMAQLTRKSPTITVNQQGFRNPEARPEEHEHVILAVGSSSALGSGVEDDQTWTAVLQQRLAHQGIDALVLNAASPAWGPFQHATLIEGRADEVGADALLVLVSSGDLNFLPKSTEAEKQRFLAEARLRKRILGLSPFLAFSIRKAEVLVLRVRNRVRAALDRFRPAATPAEPGATPTLERHRQRIAPHRRYWRQIVEHSARDRRPVVFLVLNPLQRPRDRVLVEELQALSQDNPLAEVVELGPSRAGLPEGEAASRHRRSLYRSTLTIPNDGHPNIAYHDIMARSVESAIRDALGAR